ncbi:MAG: hypothetical protein ACLP50_28560 [Solirubrobacteraceae bacterium]
MKQAHLVLGVLSIVLVGAAALWGSWCWYRVRQSASFWHLLRAGQIVIVIDVALGGVLVAIGRKTPSLHLIYGLLPVAVSFIAEQLRIASAQTVLDSRGYKDAAEVGELAEADQRAVVIAIVQRELGVMVLAALIIVVLLWRAAVTAG